MKSAQTTADAPRISSEQVAAFRLTRHHLTKRTRAASLPKVAGDMAGVQAQVMSAAQLFLWARTRGIRGRISSGRCGRIGLS